jgi:uroporphyrinogen-III synthase
MALCFHFLRDRSLVLKHAATATLQQAVALMFERADRALRDPALAAALALAVGSGSDGEAATGAPAPS